MFNYSGGKYVMIREKVQASAIIRAFMLRIYVMKDTALLLSRCTFKKTDTSSISTQGCGLWQIEPTIY